MGEVSGHRHSPSRKSKVVQKQNSMQQPGRKASGKLGIELNDGGEHPQPGMTPRVGGRGAGLASAVQNKTVTRGNHQTNAKWKVYHESKTVRKHFRLKHDNLA